MTYRLWRLGVEHPKGVLIAGATLLWLIVVLGNWRPTKAKLLVWEPELPFIVWAMIFMLVGYLTGKWIEWAIDQRRIRKGTYKPRVSPEDLAGTAAALEERLPQPDGAEEATPSPDREEEPATIIDRSARSGRPSAPSDGAVHSVDYWAEGSKGPEPAPPQPAPPRLGDRGLPERRRARPDAYAEVGAGAVEPASTRRRRGGGRYGDYADAGGSGRYGDYGDYADAAPHRGGGRYGDYADYADYADAGPGRGGGRRQ